MTTPTTTRAAVLVETGQPLQIMDLILPELKPGQVLVEMDYAGVCHTQLHEVRGRKGPDRFLPHALGHEGAGTVLAVGEGVTKVMVGDKVVLTWIKGEGAEVLGTTYESNIGKVNSGAISTFMSHTITCENRVVPMTKNELPMREAALLGCAVPTGAGVIINTADVQPGTSIAVFGVGGIGMSAVLAASMREAATIIAVDIVDEKLEAAKRAGATHTINAKREDVEAIVMDLTDGKGVDHSVEAAGLPQTMESAFRSVRTGAGLCIMAGDVPFGEAIRIEPVDLIKRSHIGGTLGGAPLRRRDLHRHSE